MNAVKVVLRTLAELIALAVLVLFFAIAIRTIVKPGDSQSSAIPQGQAVFTPESTTWGTPYVPPNWDFAQPTPLVVIHSAPSSTVAPWLPRAYPGPVYAPTYTPYPSPTLRLGPTDTPIPLVNLAQDASGVIQYVAKQGEDTISLVSQPVDALGLANSSPEQMALASPFYNLEGDIYPTMNGSHLVIVDHFRESPIGIVFDTSSGKGMPINMVPGLEKFFSWFSDNRRVLLSTNGGSLWLIDPISGEYVELVVPGYGVIDGAAASPNGTKVIYSCFQCDPTSITQVRLVDPDGRNDQFIFEIGVRSGGFSWSPDGKKIAFFGDGWTIMDADGSNPRQIGNIGMAQCYFNPPSWSPDSSTLAIVTSDIGDSFCQGWTDQVFKGTDILLVDIESGNVHSLMADGVQGNIDPAWSPDSRQIAFVSNRSGVPEIWVVNADGTDLRQLTNAGQYVRFPFWRKP